MSLTELVLHEPLRLTEGWMSANGDTLRDVAIRMAPDFDGQAAILLDAPVHGENVHIIGDLQRHPATWPGFSSTIWQPHGIFVRHGRDFDGLRWRNFSVRGVPGSGFGVNGGGHTNWTIENATFDRCHQGFGMGGVNVLNDEHSTGFLLRNIAVCSTWAGHYFREEEKSRFNVGLEIGHGGLHPVMIGSDGIFLLNAREFRLERCHSYGEMAVGIKLAFNCADTVLDECRFAGMNVQGWHTQHGAPWPRWTLRLVDTHINKGFGEKPLEFGFGGRVSGPVDVVMEGSRLANDLPHTSGGHGLQLAEVNSPAGIESPTLTLIDTEVSGWNGIAPSGAKAHGLHIQSTRTNGQPALQMAGDTRFVDQEHHILWDLR